MTTSTPTIATHVEQLTQGMAAQMPAEALAAFGAEQEQLLAAGNPSGILAPGTAMPDADLLDAHGRATTLAAARAGKPAVVVFYRGGWCPYCNIALNAYQAELLPRLRERGIELIAVSPQKPDGSLSTQEANSLTFTVVSDASGIVRWIDVHADYTTRSEISDILEAITSSLAEAGSAGRADRS